MQPGSVSSDIQTGLGNETLGRYAQISGLE